jgi:hypothetical protein
MTNRDDLLYRYYSDESLQHWVAIAGILASILLALWSLLRDRFEFSIIFIYSYLTLQLIVFLYFCLVLFASGKFKVIKLKLNIEDGHLTDVRTNFRNVALRRQTLSKILCELHSDKVFEVGKKVGNDFYQEFFMNFHLPASITETQKIEIWLKYDSGSGMGRFKLGGYTDKSLQIDLISPFYGNCPRQKEQFCKECRFLKGYITGIVNGILREKLEENDVSCRPNVTGCSFTFPRQLVRPDAE